MYGQSCTSICSIQSPEGRQYWVSNKCQMSYFLIIFNDCHCKVVAWITVFLLQIQSCSSITPSFLYIHGGQEPHVCCSFHSIQYLLRTHHHHLPSEFTVDIIDYKLQLINISYIWSSVEYISSIWDQFKIADDKFSNCTSCELSVS